MFIKNKIKLIIFMVFSTLLVACNGGKSSGDTKNSDSTKIQELTIDNSAIVPLIEGTSSSALVMIHNNSNHALSGIKYLVKNSINRQQWSLFGCANLAALSSCSLQLSLSAGNQAVLSSSLYLEAKYNGNDNLPHEAASVFNFQKINNKTSGLYINPVNLASFGNSPSRGIAYIYAIGKAGTKYKVESMGLSSNAYRIARGNLSNMTISAGSLVPVEIEGVSPTTAATLAFNIQYQDRVSSNMVSTKLGVFASSSDLNPLVASFVPLIDTESANNLQGTIYFQNLGTKPLAVKAEISEGAELFSIDPSCQGQANNVIPAGEVCQINYSLKGNVKTLTNGIVILKGINKGGSFAQARISWFNGTPIGGAVVLPDENFIFLDKDKPKIQIMTIYNPGGYTVNTSTLELPRAIEGSATGLPPTDINCLDLDGLKGHSECRIQETLIDSGDNDLGYLEFAYNGSYQEDSTGNKGLAMGKTYVPYQTTDMGAPNIIIDSPAYALSINGDGIESRTYAFIVHNLGGRAATFKEVYFDNDPSYLELDSSDCMDKPLISQKTCEIRITLGPVEIDKDSEIIRDTNLLLRGDFSPVQKAVHYEVRSKRLAMEAEFSVENQISGSGTQSDPYIFDGSQDTIKKVIWTLTNIGESVQSLNAINLKGVSPEQWSIDKADSSCYNGKNPYSPNGLLQLQLDPPSVAGGNNSCRIVFVDTYGGLPGEDTNSGAIDDHIIFPDIMVTVVDNTEFMPPTAKPGDADEVWVRKTIGNVSIKEEFTNQGFPNNALKLTYALNNAEKYGTVNVFATQLSKELFDYQNYSSGSGCDVKIDSSNPEYLKVSCPVVPNQPSTISIPLRSEYLRSGDMGFMLKFSNDLTDGNKVIQMNQYAVYLTAKQTHGYIYTTSKNISIRTSGWDGSCAQDDSGKDLYKRGYRHFVAVNFDDSSGYLDDVPESFPLYNLDKNGADEHLVTRVSKGMAAIPGEPGKKPFKLLFEYPFTNPIGPNSYSMEDNYVYIHGSAQYMTYDNKLDNASTLIDCSKSENNDKNVLLYYSHKDMMNDLLTEPNQLRHILATKTEDGIQADSAAKCSKISVRTLCTAY